MAYFKLSLIALTFFRIQIIPITRPPSIEAKDEKKLTKYMQNDSLLNGILPNTHVLKYEIPFEKFVEALKPLLDNDPNTSNINKLPIYNNLDKHLSTSPKGLLELMKAVIDLKREESQKILTSYSTNLDFKPSFIMNDNIKLESKKNVSIKNLKEKLLLKTPTVALKDIEKGVTLINQKTEKEELNDIAVQNRINSIPKLMCGKNRSCPYNCFCNILPHHENGICCPGNNQKAFQKLGICPTITTLRDAGNCLTIGNLCCSDYDCGPTNIFKCCPSPCGLRCLSPQLFVLEQTKTKNFMNKSNLKRGHSFSEILENQVINPTP